MKIMVKVNQLIPDFSTTGYESISILCFFTVTATTEIYTLALHAALPIVLPKDTALMTVFNRYGETSKPGQGVLEGWGEWSGAIATTILHDSHNLAVFGYDPDDMAAAANALIACGGGMAVAKDGKVVAMLDLPVCGLLSTAEPEDVAVLFQKVRDAAADVSTWEGLPVMIKLIIGASLACNPGPHVTDLGITDGMTGRIVTDMVIPA